MHIFVKVRNCRKSKKQFRLLELPDKYVRVEVEVIIPYMLHRRVQRGFGVELGKSNLNGLNGRHLCQVGPNQ